MGAGGGIEYMGSPCLDDMRARGGAGKIPANEPDGRKTILIRQWLLTDRLIDHNGSRRRNRIHGFLMPGRHASRRRSWKVSGQWTRRTEDDTDTTMVNHGQVDRP